MVSDVLKQYDAHTSDSCRQHFRTNLGHSSLETTALNLGFDGVDAVSTLIHLGSKGLGVTVELLQLEFVRPQRLNALDARG